MRLLLIRHGEIPTNVARLLDTRIPGPSLTPKGWEQARRLLTILGLVPVEAVYASTMIRTQLTAQPFANSKGLHVRVRAGVREIHAGDHEMLGEEKNFDTYLGVLGNWVQGDVSTRMPGAESGEEFLTRFDRVVAEIEEEGHETAVIVSHGAAIRVWATIRTNNLQPDFTRDHKVANGSVVELLGDSDQGWRAVSWAGIALDGDAALTGCTLWPQPQDSSLL